jgi:hypothetical protein
MVFYGKINDRFRIFQTNSGGKIPQSTFHLLFRRNLMKKALFFHLALFLFIPLICFAQKPVKTPLAVNDLAGEGIEASEARIISDRLRSELINSEMFRVMERGEMESILKEQGFQQSGMCNDKSCMVEMGQILGVHQIIAGSVGKIGGMYTISTRMINVTSGEVQFSVTLDCKCPISELLTKSVPSIAQQIVTKIKAANAPAKEQAAPAPAASGEPSSTEKKAVAPGKKKGVAAWVIWVPATVVVVGGGVAAYVLLSPKKETEQQTGGVVVQW